MNMTTAQWLTLPLPIDRRDLSRTDYVYIQGGSLFCTDGYRLHATPMNPELLLELVQSYPILPESHTNLVVKSYADVLSREWMFHTAQSRTRILHDLRVCRMSEGEVYELHLGMGVTFTLNSRFLYEALHMEGVMQGTIDTVSFYTSNSGETLKVEGANGQVAYIMRKIKR